MTLAAMAWPLSAQAFDKVTFGTNWLAEAEHGGFYQALSDGTYDKYGLDVTIQQEVLDILVRLQAKYRLSVFFISHDLALVNRYANRIGVLYGGVLMETGSTVEVIGRPARRLPMCRMSCSSVQPWITEPAPRKSRALKKAWVIR